jgi:hypothetical protein
MYPLETAIMRTVLYGDVFNYPMTVEEIHHFLIHETITPLDDIRHTLENSAYLRERLVVMQGYVACADRADLIPLRLERATVAQTLWTPALDWGYCLACLPFVRLVGLTGALSMHNPSTPQDDLDYILVTREGRVWLARVFAILLVYTGRLRGVTVCPNYVLAENVLEQAKRDLYIAHEITQMIPIYGHNLYHRLRSVNAWTVHHLPNAAAPFHHADERAPGMIGGTAKRALEFILGGKFGDYLEAWERRRKLRQFAAELEASTAAAQLDDTQVKGHFNDHGQRVLDQYHERLRRYHLLEPISSAAD